jgi:hypothetical protein
MKRASDPSRAARGYPDAWRRLWPDQRGATAVIVAISVPIMLAMAGLGVDAGWWYTIKRQNQSAADAAAVSAAYEVAANLTDVTNNLTPAAKQAATQNGWVNDANPPAGLTPIAVTYPCCAGTFAAGGIQVVLQQQQSSWLANFASLANVTISNRAVAVVSKLPPSCMLALDPTTADAINVAGNPIINAPSCTIVSDSNASSAVHLQGSATIDAATVITPGQISNTGGAYTLNLSFPAQTGASPVPDPYAGTLTHAALTSGLATAPVCSSRVNGTVTTYYGAVAGAGNCKFVNGLSLSGGTYDLSPGTYWITDGNLKLGPGGSGTTLECSVCTNGGAGVTIILTTAQPSGGKVGTLTLDSLANINLNAPSSGTFAGMVIIQDSNGLPTGTTINSPGNAQANATEQLSGLVYFPKTTVTFQGTPTSGGPQCLVLIADKIALQGNPGFATDGCSSEGLNNLPFPKTITLVD